MNKKEILQKAGRKSVNLGTKVLKKNSHIRSLTEKSLRVAIRELGPEFDPQPLSSSSRYAKWLKLNSPNRVDLVLQKKESESFNYQPLFSILLPVYKVDLKYLKQCIKSVYNQTYPNWELCIVEDFTQDQSITDYLSSLAKSDPKVKFKPRSKNGHISLATQDCEKLAKGDYLCFIDHDDILRENALYEFARALNNDSSIDFIYSDEDKIGAKGKDRTDPFFKPDWSPELLTSINYISHFTAIKRTLYKEVGGIRAGYEGAQDWDLYLRATKKAKKVVHVPKVLYSWRVIPGSTAGGLDEKSYINKAQEKTLMDFVRSNKLPANVVYSDKFKNYSLQYKVNKSPLVSIVVPTKDVLKTLKVCLSSVLEKTTYKNYEVIIVDTGSTETGVKEYYSDLQKKHKNIKQVEWIEEKFSYSKSCNFGVKQSKGEFVLLLNNDTEVITPNWIELMLAEAQRKEVGGVGCLLYFPEKDYIQHAGTAMGISKLAGNILSRLNLNKIENVAQSIFLGSKKELLAVTAACMMISRKKFDQVKGLDENEFKVTFNDVDLSLKLHEAGYRNLYLPYVELTHYESLSLGTEKDARRDKPEIKAASKALQAKWKKYIEYDPYYNINFSRLNCYALEDTDSNV